MTRPVYMRYVGNGSDKWYITIVLPGNKGLKGYGRTGAAGVWTETDKTDVEDITRSKLAKGYKQAESGELSQTTINEMVNQVQKCVQGATTFNALSGEFTFSDHEYERVMSETYNNPRPVEAVVDRSWAGDW